MIVQKVQAPLLSGHLTVWSSFTYCKTSLFQTQIAQAWTEAIFGNLIWLSPSSLNLITDLQFSKFNLFYTNQTTSNLVYFLGLPSGAWLIKHATTLLDNTKSLLVREQAIIPHNKEESQAVHMSPITQQLIKKPAFLGLIPLHTWTRLVHHTPIEHPTPFPSQHKVHAL